MFGPKPGARPRVGGGFNPGLGGMNEHIDENDMQAAMQQKALSQQAASPTTAQAAAAGQAQQQKPYQQQKPRSIGTLPQELIVRPAKDIFKGLLSIFDFNSMMGIDPQKDTPEEQQKKRVIHQNWQKLTDEQKQVAKKKYDEELKEQQLAEQEEEKKKQEAEQQNKEPIAPPSSPKKGPIGPGMSKKQKAQAKLTHDRKRLSGPSSVS